MRTEVLAAVQITISTDIIARVTSKNTLIMHAALVILTPDYQSAFYCTLSRELLWCRAITFLLRRTFLLPFITCDKRAIAASIYATYEARILFVHRSKIPPSTILPVPPAPRGITFLRGITLTIYIDGLSDTHEGTITAGVLIMSICIDNENYHLSRMTFA